MSAFDRIKRILTEHKRAIVLAVITSIIVAIPQVLFRVDHARDGINQGIELLPDSFWSPRVREVQDGHLNFGSIYWKEGKDGPYLFQPLGSIIIAYMGGIFSLDINDTLLLSRVVLTFSVFLLIYTFVLLLSREKTVAVSSATIIILADAVLDPRGLISFLHGESPVSFLVFGQPVMPATIYLFFFSFLVAFLQFFRTRVLSYGVLSAFLLGLNFYNYFYAWTYLYAFGGLLGLFLLFKKRWKDAIGVAGVYIGALIVAVPYIVNLHHATLYATYAEVSERVGILYTHAPLFVGVVVLISIVIFFLGYPKEDKEQYLFSLALLLTPFVTLNQQILTGKVMQAGHYHYYLHKPIAIILSLIVVFAFLTRKKLYIYKNALGIFAIGVGIFIGCFIQYASYTRDNEYGGSILIERQKYGPVMRWLAEHTEKEGVIFGNDEVSQLVTIYTPLNVFYHRAAPYSSLAATEDRLRDVLFTFYRLRGVTREDAREIFFEERGYISINLYHLHYQELYGAVENIPDEELEKVLRAYYATLEVPSEEYLRNILKKYEVEYLVWDKKSDPTWQVTQYPFLKSVVTFGDIGIYQINAETRLVNK